jgi:flagellar biosynthetic protein FlhB
MAEENGDKTEAPTPKRRQQAAEQGRVARSQDLVAAALVVGSMLLLKSYGGRLVAALEALLREMLGAASLSDFRSRGAVEGLGRSLVLMGQAMLPLLTGLLLIAVVCNALQVGLRFNPAKLQPSLAALNPFKGFGRVFSMSGRSPVQGLMTLLKFLAICGVAYSAVHDRMAAIVGCQAMDYMEVFRLGATTVYEVALRIGVALLILAIVDYLYQRWKLERDLKMTKQEVKDEMRSMEGDPKLKMRRRQIAMQIAHNRLKKDVPTADVVVTNPTEFAVALKYDADTMRAPRVIAKGQGQMAMRIRQLAIAAGVPILERKPLARALYKLVEVGQEIPEDLYATVAEILAYVYELTGKVGRKQAV